MENEFKGIIFVVIAIIALVVVGMVIFPQYKVWFSKLSGEAQLREAEYSKQVQVEQAKADLESAKLWKDAEVTRAEGTAKSAEIINQKLEQNTNYLQYLAIQAQEKMADSPNHTQIYIPSGSNGIPLIKVID